MAYQPRYLIICDDSYFHVTWRCHNKDWLLKWDWAKKLYYDLLLKYKDQHGIEIYSYNFMDNHPHLTGHLKSKEQFSAFFRLINGLFARAVNKQLGRCGQVVMDRFKSPRIETDKHMLTAMTYIDLNPYRVGKVTHPRQNNYSSYRYYAYGKKDPLLTPSPSYLTLGNTDEERQQEYRSMVDALLSSKETKNISTAHFIGNPEWVIKMSGELRVKMKNKILEKQTSSTAPPC